MGSGEIVERREHEVREKRGERGNIMSEGTGE